MPGIPHFELTRCYNNYYSSLFSGGSDYAVIEPFTLTFNSTIRQFTFGVLLIDDDAIENTENLNATLGFPGGIAPPRVSIAEETTQITIFDDDRKQ